MSSAPSKPWSLAARLTAGFAASAFLLLAIAAVIQYWSLKAHLDEEQDAILTGKAQILAALVGDPSSGMGPLRQEIEWEWEVSRQTRVAMRVLDESGRPIIESPGLATLLPPGKFPAPDAAAVVIHADAGGEYRALSVTARTASGDARMLQLALDRTEDNGLLSEFRNVLGVVLAAAPLGGAAIGYWVARRGLKPVAEISQTASRINAETLGERLPTAHLPAELAELGVTFNAMLDRLEESFARVTRFSADIAHELRTPMQVLRGESELALSRDRPAAEYRETLASGLEEYERLARLIDSLLFLARADNPGAQLARESLDLAAEIESTRAYYESLASEAGAVLITDVPPDLHASLDRTLFQRALGNLVSNAIAHTPPGGQVTIRADRSDGTIQIEVADTGRGIAAEHLPHIFDRFYRADSARTTSTAGHVGLGLALVKSIAELHGGSVEATSRPDEGASLRMHLPG